MSDPIHHVNREELCAGDLIKLLQDLPYDTLIRIDAPADVPGSSLREEYVLIGGGFGQVGEGSAARPTAEFFLTAEFPDGTYEA